MTALEFSYEEKYIEMARSLVLEETLNLPCAIVLFGSRARGNFRRSSDVDIGISGLSGEKFFELKNKIAAKLEESLIPYRVDIVDLDHCRPQLQANAWRDAQIWKKA